MSIRRGATNDNTPRLPNSIRRNVEGILKSEGIALSRSIADASVTADRRPVRLPSRTQEATFEQAEQAILEASRGTEDDWAELVWGSGDGTVNADLLDRRTQDLELDDVVTVYRGGPSEDAPLRAALAQTYQAAPDVSNSAVEKPAINRLNYVVLNSSRLDAGAVNADALAVWLRGVPATDLARAVPYLRVNIIQPSNTVARQGAESPLSWGFSLDGSDVPDGRRWTSEVSERPEIANVFSERTRAGGAAGLARNIAGGSRIGSAISRPQPSQTADTVHVSTADVFHAPQTFRAKGEYLDPFKPHMSILNFQVSDSPTGQGMISYRTAKMALKLHDRSRARDVRQLLSPQYFGRVVFEIEWGWACNLPDSMHTPYTRMIDQMRVKEIYSLVRSNFGLQDDKGMTIDLDLVLLPNTSLSEAPIMIGSITEEGVNISEQYDRIKQIAERIADLLEQAGRSTTGDLAVNVSGNSFLRRFTSVENILNISGGDEVVEQIRNFIDANRDATGLLGKLVQELKELFGERDPSIEVGPSSRRRL